jgi:putative restriction endonuclease
MSTSKEQNYGAPWTREELILAFDLYCRIPFRKTKASNPEVQRLAMLIKRTSASVARKLGNFGAFDPELKRRNISGLIHGSKLDREIWDEFHKNWNTLVLRARNLRESLGRTPKDLIDIEFPKGPSEREIKGKQRIHQSFFRQAVLSSYEYTCCITGINIPECLTASHIVPWSISEKYRTDPTNGLCLSATFDRLFDNGLITISNNLNVVISGNLLKTSGPSYDLVCSYHMKPIIPPKRFLPSAERLKWHYENIFLH